MVLAAGFVAVSLVGCGAGGTTTVQPGAAPTDPVPSSTGGFNQELHDALPAAVRTAGTIRVGTDASYAPASFFAPDGRTIIGFEPDLGAALGEVLGVEVAFGNADFTTMLPELAQGRFDVAISAMTDTQERQLEADFVNYFTAGTSVVVQRGNPHAVADLRDLCGEVVAVEDGTIQVDLLERTQQSCQEPIEITTHATNSDALLQLRTGRAVAVLNDYPPAAYLASDPQTEAHYQLATDTQYEPGMYGMAVAKDNVELRDALFGALQQLMREGAYDEILDTWAVDEGALRQASVNSGCSGTSTGD